MNEDLFVGAKVEWIGDRVRTIADIKPRHIGRVCTFTHFWGSDPDASEYADVMGTLEGYNGSEIIVSGDAYVWGQMADFKIYRSRLVS